jgi:hypothetical protein
MHLTCGDGQEGGIRHARQQSQDKNENKSLHKFRL